MSGMAKFLQEKGKYTILTMSYPSTMADVEEHAKGLARVLHNLDGIEEIDFVAHSLGNLVVRRYLDDQINAGHNQRPISESSAWSCSALPITETELAVTIAHNPLARTDWCHWPRTG